MYNNDVITDQSIQSYCENFINRNIIFSSEKELLEKLANCFGIRFTDNERELLYRALEVKMLYDALLRMRDNGVNYKKVLTIEYIDLD